jgi:hypothetical protein
MTGGTVCFEGSSPAWKEGEEKEESQTRSLCRFRLVTRLSDTEERSRFYIPAFEHSMALRTPPSAGTSMVGQRRRYSESISFFNILSGSLRAGPMKASRLLFLVSFHLSSSILFSRVPNV